jgi:hypothetical protein
MIVVGLGLEVSFGKHPSIRRFPEKLASLRSFAGETGVRHRNGGAGTALRAGSFDGFLFETIASYS